MLAAVTRKILGKSNTPETSESTQNFSLHFSSPSSAAARKRSWCWMPKSETLKKWFSKFILTFPSLLPLFWYEESHKFSFGRHKFHMREGKANSSEWHSKSLREGDGNFFPLFSLQQLSLSLEKKTTSRRRSKRKMFSHFKSNYQLIFLDKRQADDTQSRSEDCRRWSAETTQWQWEWQRVEKDKSR